MKTRAYYSFFSRSIFLIFLIATSLFATAIPDYDFRNPVLISGVNLKVGAKYRFSNVRPGVDALVTIIQFTGGCTLNQLDGGSGYVEAFQPVIDIAAKSSGYVEFKIDFVAAGTAVPMIMLEVPATPIDVDGSTAATGNLYEYDMIYLNPAGSYVDYAMVGSELTVTTAANWVTGKNISGTNYTGIDTAARNVMFSAVNSNVSTITLRVGVDNKNNVQDQRLRSVYFQKFVYSSSFLFKAPLLSFTGVAKKISVDLNWEIATDNMVKTITIERGVNPQQFSTIAEIQLADEIVGKTSFNYADNISVQNNLYYRLKIVSTNGTETFSRIQLFRPVYDNQLFKVYPTSIQSSITLNIRSEKVNNGSFLLVDYSGKIVYQKNIQLQTGNNNILINPNNLFRGNYTAVIQIDNKTYSQKIYKQD